MQIQNIDLTKIVRCKHKLGRKADAKHVQALASSVRSVGLLHPITLRKAGTGYELLAGDHRLRAYRLLERRTIPAIVLQADDATAELISIDENLQRWAGDVYEQAEALARWQELHEVEHGQPKRGGGREGAGRNPTKIGKAKKSAQILTEIKPKPPDFERQAAEQLGVSRETIRQTVDKFKRLTPEAKQAWEKKQITGSQATELAKLPAKKQTGLLPELKSKTRDETRALIKANKPTDEDKMMELFIVTLIDPMTRASALMLKAALRELGAAGEIADLEAEVENPADKLLGLENTFAVMQKAAYRGDDYDEDEEDDLC